MSSSEQTPPPTDAFIRALSECQSALRGLLPGGARAWRGAKEAWQRTNVVLWRKAGDWNVETPFLRWALAVARYEVLATVRAQTGSFTPRVYAPGKYTVKAGKDKPDTVVAKGVPAG